MTNKYRILSLIETLRNEINDLESMVCEIDEPTYDAKLYEQINLYEEWESDVNV